MALDVNALALSILNIADWAFQQIEGARDSNVTFFYAYPGGAGGFVQGLYSYAHCPYDNYLMSETECRSSSRCTDHLRWVWLS